MTATDACWRVLSSSVARRLRWLARLSFVVCYASVQGAQLARVVLLCRVVLTATAALLAGVFITCVKLWVYSEGDFNMYTVPVVFQCGF